jgi:hypothetical protein
MVTRGEHRFSSRMKQNKKAKIYAVFCFAGKKNCFCYIYAVIVKQNFYKRSTNHYCDGDADFDCAVAKIAESVHKMLQKALSNEMQSAAMAMSSRSHSPAPTDVSGASTMPGTPQ